MRTAIKIGLDLRLLRDGSHTSFEGLGKIKNAI